MDRLQRWYKLDRLLKARRFPVARAVLEDELEASASTVKRIISEMRDFGAPIETSGDRAHARAGIETAIDTALDRYTKKHQNATNMVSFW